MVLGKGNFIILSAACSEAATIMADGLPVIMPGKMEASTTNRLAVPYTLVLTSTTAVPLGCRPSSVPILLVPIHCVLAWEAFDNQNEKCVGMAYRSSDWSPSRLVWRESFGGLSIAYQQGII